MQKQIIIEVDEQGKIHFETDGFVGEECIHDEVVNYVKEQLGRGLGPEFKPDPVGKIPCRFAHNIQA